MTGEGAGKVGAGRDWQDWAIRRIEADYTR